MLAFRILKTKLKKPIDIPTSIMKESTYIHGTTPEEQERLATLNKLSNPHFISFMEIHPSDRVLEIGSGLGILARDVAISTGADVTGIEISEDQLSIARSLTSGATMIHGDAHHLPFEDASFDVVYCRYILEHVADPLRVMMEAKRVLKPGGRFYNQENNNEIQHTWPDCPAFQHAWKAFEYLQADMGGDALIGKKLYAMAYDTGFQDIQISLQPEMHGYNEAGYGIWVKNLIALLMGAKSHIISDKYLSDKQFNDAISELEALHDNPRGAVYFYWNRLKAKKKAG
jgi:ubiquinone/menaquinone biosynthesis C-methylase UbiE